MGRRIVYAKPSAPEFVADARRRGLPWGLVLVMTGIYTTARLGLADRVTPDLERLLGRPPATLRRFVEENRSLFWA